MNSPPSNWIAEHLTDAGEFEYYGEKYRIVRQMVFYEPLDAQDQAELAKVRREAMEG